MKLYRSTIPDIARRAVIRLTEEGDVDIAPEMIEESIQDLVAIMEDYSRRDSRLREDIKDHMASRNLSYDQYGRVRSRMAQSRNHPLGSDVERYLARQFLEMMLNSPSVEEVYGEDKVILRKLGEVLESFDVDEDAIREEAKGKVKNAREGTMEYEILLNNAILEVKRKKGLL